MRPQLLPDTSPDSAMLRGKRRGSETIDPDALPSAAIVNNELVAKSPIKRPQRVAEGPGGQAQPAPGTRVWITDTDAVTNKGAAFSTLNSIKTDGKEVFVILAELVKGGTFNAKEFCNSSPAFSPLTRAVHRFDTVAVVIHKNFFTTFQQNYIELLRTAGLALRTAATHYKLLDELSAEETAIILKPVRFYVPAPIKFGGEKNRIMFSRQLKETVEFAVAQESYLPAVINALIDNGRRVSIAISDVINRKELLLVNVSPRRSHHEIVQSARYIFLGKSKSTKEKHYLRTEDILCVLSGRFDDSGKDMTKCQMLLRDPSASRLSQLLSKSRAANKEYETFGLTFTRAKYVPRKQKAAEEDDGDVVEDDVE